MNKKFEIFIVYAFCGENAKGNSAGVLLLDDFPSDDILQRIAAEVNLSETAFVSLKKTGHYRLRWFTPTREVRLCGHATLASAFVLYRENKINEEKISFDSLSGILEVKKKSPSEFELNFPRDFLNPIESLSGIEEALGSDVLEIFQGREDYLVLLKNEDSLHKLAPDFEKLKAIKSRGFIITSETHRKGFDFVSRFFAPNYGINEDPATGSAHCTLAEYWSKRLKRFSLKGYQASKQGGIVNIRLEKERVYLSGSAYLENKIEI